MGDSCQGFLQLRKEKNTRNARIKLPKVKDGFAWLMIKIYQTTFPESRRLTWSVSSLSLSSKPVSLTC